MPPPSGLSGRLEKNTLLSNLNPNYFGPAITTPSAGRTKSTVGIPIPTKIVMLNPSFIVTWILPEEKGLNSGAGSDDHTYVSWIMEQFFGRRRERVQGPAVLLDMCFCAPSYHRRGAGKQLVQWGTKKADELGLTAFVEASLTGRRLYESCGFVVMEDVCLEGGKVKEEWKGYGQVEYKFMVREKK